MPKREDIRSILVVGAGPIVIGQACEFDYSGTQACKILREEGYKIILVNSNPATIMTDPATADHVYIEPITPEAVEKIIQKEKPDAILSTVGGQTALNCSLELAKRGILQKYNVEMIGANPEAIEKAENRQLFNEAMAKIGLEVPKNTVVHSIDEAMEQFKTIGLPAIIRPSFTLGGSGGGIAYTEEEYKDIVRSGLEASPTNEVLIDQSILGWKEYEMEVIRDKDDNAIIVCSIENLDPMGVHTGDSITVAPALTLTDKEYQIMRDASLAVLREIGVETGGSNVQFAVNPKNGQLVVIEMNPRVSRSSALASKATGYPIAKVAARLAVGYTLPEIANDITKITPASFEPTIDYIVTKIPRFTFEKFPKTRSELSTQMKSVGEAMSIGRSFAESLQKGLRSMETGLSGFNEPKIEDFSKNNSLEKNQAAIKRSLNSFASDRILRIAHAIRYDISLKEINEITKYDPWFLEQIKKIVDAEKKIQKEGLPANKSEMLFYKKLGFSDKRIAELTNLEENKIRKKRRELSVHPVYKKVDTCAAEFGSNTSYLYSCYEGNSYFDAECESNPTNKKKVIILGGGPNRIGQGIEFDYACVHAAMSLREENIETIMVNCNPETVSTDYDTSDKLYFEPLTNEDVIELIKKEMTNGSLLGVVVQFGGQTPLKLSKAIEKENIPIIGTSPDKIDLAEDRERFKTLLEKVNLKQPINDICYNVEDIKNTIEKVGYPVVIRPSNVLGGRAMEIIHNHSGLEKYLKINGSFILDGPILIDKFLNNATEIDVDALCDGKQVFVAGIMEHIEEAGIHSGDSACTIPTLTLSEKQIEEIKQATEKLGKELEVIGLMNIQYAYQDGTLYIIEVNPRASRTVPFVAKATGNSIAKIAVKLMVGREISEFKLNSPTPNHYSVKEVTFPFSRFDAVDTILGPEMKSTGEAMGIDSSFGIAYYKAQQAVGNTVPTKGGILVTVQDIDKEKILSSIQIFKDCGFKIYATKGTTKFLKNNGIDAIQVKKEKEDKNDIANHIASGHFNFVVNTTSGGDDILESFSIRRTSIMNRIPYVTTVAGFKACAEALKNMRTNSNNFSVKTIQDWVA